MKHQETYYTCDNCGVRLGEEHTHIEVSNTDVASTLALQEFHLCAQHWLDVYKILSKQKRKAEASAEPRRDEYDYFFDDRA